MVNDTHLCVSIEKCHLVSGSACSSVGSAIASIDDDTPENPVALLMKVLALVTTKN